VITLNVTVFKNIMPIIEHTWLTQKEPAYNVLSYFKSNRKLAKRLGVSASTVTRWTYPRIMGGTDGHIPQKYWLQIMHIAKVEGLSLTIEHLSGLKYDN
jgi:DNA-directed RNA polymerase specialized sigma54-like protein